MLGQIRYQLWTLIMSTLVVYSFSDKSTSAQPAERRNDPSTVWANYLPLDGSPLLLRFSFIYSFYQIFSENLVATSRKVQLQKKSLTALVSHYFFWCSNTIDGFGPVICYFDRFSRSGTSMSTSDMAIFLHTTSKMAAPIKSKQRYFIANLISEITSTN